MEQTLRLPEFKTEGDEARWWVENQTQLARLFEQAAAKGKLARGTIVGRGNTPTTTIRLDPEDIAKARFHAERKGLKYQTYLKMLIRQALRQEELQAALSMQGERSVVSKPAKRTSLHGRSGSGEAKIPKKRSK